MLMIRAELPARLGALMLASTATPSGDRFLRMSSRLTFPNHGYHVSDPGLPLNGPMTSEVTQPP